MKRKKKRVVRFDRIFLVLLFFVFLAAVFWGVWNLKITNIYIYDNTYLTDQEIIEKANLQGYPATFQNLSTQIEKRLQKDINIKGVTVHKKWFTQVFITIEENRPLFYYENNHQTVLLDGSSVDKKYSVPTVLNYITDKYYQEFIKQIGTLNTDVLGRISEIQFTPTEVDESRFLLSMSDGNYVYINLQTFSKMDKYLSILENLPNKNGILYLDYGNNFEIIE